jgi:transposase InsO family protein
LNKNNFKKKETLMSTLQCNTKIIQNKIGLLNLAEELGNVAKACRIMGVSRDTFYRYQEAKEQGGTEALFDKSRKNPNFKNRVSPEIEKATVELAIEEPAWGQHRASNELRKRGFIISPAGVRCVWLRYNLECIKKRLTALEEKVAKEGTILTESQLRAMEKRVAENEAHGEIETEHPGYLGAQDTFYVGTLKGVGRVYQQTFVDTYSKMAFAKLYTMKTSITAADILNDKVLPFFEEQSVPLLRILTDRGTEYCGKIDGHEYQLYLAIRDIDHTRTKARHPQTNGIVERFHKTILDEFYNVAFRKKIYNTLEELQLDLEKYLMKYNFDRTHQGKMCCGRTPWETFLDGKKIVHSKVIDGKKLREVL